MRARMAGRQQADPRPAVPLRQLVAAHLQQRSQGGAVPLGLGQGLLQPPVQVADQLGDAGLLATIARTRWPTSGELPGLTK